MRQAENENDALGQEFAAAMGGRACLMRGHGITTCGKAVGEATLTAIKLNELAEMNYRAYLLGQPQSIPAEEIAQIMAGRKGRGSHAAASWRYYCSLAGEET
jgi:ribulose-5-phosphate 4-epimerase/fuculose-1-phosphate aldolase